MFKRFALLVAAVLLLLSACTPRDLADMVMDANNAARVAASADVDPTEVPTAQPTALPWLSSAFPPPSGDASASLDGYFPEQMAQMADFDMSEEEKLAIVLLGANFDAALKHDYERAAQYNVNYLEIFETNTDYLDSIFYATEDYVLLGTANVRRSGNEISGNVAYTYKAPRVSATMPFFCYDEFVIDVSEEPTIIYFDMADVSDADRRAGAEAIRQRAEEEFGVDNYLDYLDFGTEMMDVPDAKELEGFDGAVAVTYPYGWVGNVLPGEMTVDLYSSDFEARGTISILDMTENGEGMSLEEIGNAVFETLEGTLESDESGELNGLDGHMLEGTTTFEISDYDDVCTMRVFVVQSEDRERVYAVVGIFDENTLKYEEDAAYGIMESLVVQ